MENWKAEAQKQAAAAGELQIAMGERLEEIRTRISVASQTLAVEDNNFDRVVLDWKLGHLREEEKWLTQVLYGRK